MRKTLFLILFAVLAIGAVFGQINIQAGQTVNEIFDAIGTSATATLPTAWKADKNTTVRLVGTYSAALTATERIAGNSMSSTSSAGIYNFGAGVAAEATDRSIGFISSSSGTKSGNLYLQLINNGTSAINSFTISYNVEKYRMGSNAAGFSMQMYYSTDGTTWTSAGASFLTSFAADASNAGYDSAPGATVNVSGALPQVLTAGSSIYLAWNYSVTTGTTTSNSQALSIDDVSIIAAGGAPSPVIGISGALVSFTTTTGTPSAPQSYTVTGSNLTGDITIITPTGFEWAITADATTWYQSFALASSWNAPIYVRMTGANQGTFNGIITHTSPGATLVEVSVSGQVDDPVPTILPVGTLSAFNTIVGTPSTAQQYALTGAFLTTNIVVAAPAGFELSTDGTTYTSGLSLAPAFNGQIHVRLIGTTVGTYTGNITHNSTGAPEVLVAVSGSVTDPSVPTTFLEENFPYTAGTTLVSNGWVAHSGVGSNSPIVADAGLTYPGYPPASGLAGKTINNGEDVHKNFTAQTYGVVYGSVLVNMTNTTETGAYIYHFATDAATTTDHKARLWVGRDASNNVRFGLQKQVTTVWTDYVYALNTTYLVVLKYEIVPGATNDLVSAWINPVIGATEPAPQLTGTATETDIGVTGLGSVAIRQSSADIIGVFDGIRVTNSWALLWDGTPPPPPEITVTGELTPFTSTVNTPSEVQSYTLAGSNLTASLVAQAPSGFQLSTNGTDGWTDLLTLASNYNGLIYVRMLTTAANTYEGDIHHTSTGADPVDLHVSGESFNPAVIWNITQNLQQFSQEAGTPSENQSYSLSASNATANIGITVEAPFELSTTGSSNWLTTLDLAPAFNGTIYVRMNSATAGPFSSTIVHSTADASNYDIAVSGTATAPPGIYASDLFFSEYIEGGSNNKAVEIFNGTGVPVDLSNYTVKLGANGNAWGNTYTAPLGTMLAHGDVWVIANSGSNAAILAVSDITSNVTFYNGDDALGLFNGETQVDAFGIYPSTVSVYWAVAGVAGASLNHTLIRKPTITQGNLDWAASAGTTADNSEWVVQAQDYIADLGMHTFAPGAQVVATPVFTPAGGVYDITQSVTIESATTDASIYYTTDGTDPTDLSTPYTVAISVSTTTTLKAKAYKTGYTPSAVASAIYYFPTNVSTIAALRAQATGTTAYRLTGEAVLTFQQNTTRHPKYIQDATAAIVIDDPSAIISTTYNLYDGITGITGTLADYNGLLQFTPVADPGAATSAGNVIVPEVRTLASLTSADQGKLIKVMNVNIDAALVNFPTYAANINATDPTATRVLRTFASTDYVSTPIPTVATDIVCLVGQYLTDMQISPRSLADMTASATGTLDSPVVTITRDGNNVVLNWNAVPGANGGYRIEADADPYGSFAETYTVATGVLTWSQTSAEKKFYRVVALP